MSFKPIEELTPTIRNMHTITLILFLLWYYGARTPLELLRANENGLESIRLLSKDTSLRSQHKETNKTLLVPRSVP